MMSYPHPSLSDGAILLRTWTTHDLSAVEQASHDPYIPATTSIPPVYSEALGRKWIERQQQRVSSGMGLPFCVADVQTNVPLGFIGLWLDQLSQGRGRLGYWVIPAARGRGIASAALRLLSPWVFEKAAVRRLELFIEPWNLASVRVAEQAGFAREGVLHSFINRDESPRDVLLYVRYAIVGKDRAF
jgi:ribosomal-protein-alanine N-acetyltransferase